MMMKKPVVIIHETTHETQTHNANNKVVGDSIEIDTTTTMEPHKTKIANALDCELVIKIQKKCIRGF